MTAHEIDVAGPLRRGAPIRTAVIPVAGGQAAFLPATKVMPREMLTIVDTPLVQFAIDEARAAGVERFVFVERSGETLLKRHLSADAQAEMRFGDHGPEAARKAREAALPEGAAVFVAQDGGPGLGRAIAAAAPHVAADEPFAVILPDDVIAADPPVLAQMAARYPEHGGAMIAGIEVTRAKISRYGIMRIEDSGGDDAPVTSLVEKPESRVTRSNFAITGRYILPPQIFSALEAAEPDARGALQLTDAINMLVGALPVVGARYHGERFDCGSPAGLVRANLFFALRRADLRADVLPYVRRMLERADRAAEREARARGRVAPGGRPPSPGGRH